MRKFPAPLLLLLLASQALAQSAAPSQPDLQDLMHRVVQRAKVEKEARLDSSYTYRQKRTVEKLSAEGKVVERSVLLFDVVPAGDHVAYQVIEKDGRALSADEQRKEASKLTRLRDSAKSKQTKDDDVQLDEELLSRYRFTYAGAETVSGRPAFVLRFAPRPGELPEKRRIDRVLNRLSGTVWVDQGTYAISKADVSLTEPVKFFIGLGAVRALRITAEMALVDGQWLLPRANDVSYDARALFSNLRVKQHSEYSDYRRVSTTAEKR